MKKIINIKTLLCIALVLTSYINAMEENAAFFKWLFTPPQNIEISIVQDDNSLSHLLNNNNIEKILQEQADEEKEASKSLNKDDKIFLTTEVAQPISQKENEEKNTQSTTNISSLPPQHTKTSSKKRVRSKTENTECFKKKQVKKSRFGKAIVTQGKNISTEILDKRLANRLLLFKSQTINKMSTFFPFFKPESSDEKYLNYTRRFLNTYKFPLPITLFITRKFILKTPMNDNRLIFKEKTTSILEEVVTGNSVPALKNITDLLMKKIELSDTGRARQLLKKELETVRSPLNNQSDMAKFITQTIATLDGK